MRAILLAALLSLIGGTAFADDDVIVGDPTACHLKIEYEAKEQMLHLRPAIPAGAGCTITPLMVQAGLYLALDRHGSNPALRSIFLGRLVNYPWLSDELSARARCNSDTLGFWDSEKGAAIENGNNAYVASVLMDRIGRCRGERKAPMLDVFAEVLREKGYALTGASVEKVLMHYLPPSGDIAYSPGGKFPYDALTHLDIRKAP
jgi:hypothetical protein